MPLAIASPEIIFMSMSFFMVLGALMIRSVL
jgi:hypothetical protein